MSYEPTVWVDGDHVTSAKLNKLEQGVNSMSYTPTVWNAGDVVTAEKLNKLEQGVAEGGGGGMVIPTVTVDMQTMTYTSTVAFADWVSLINNSPYSIEYEGEIEKQYPIYVVGVGEENKFDTSAFDSSTQKILCYSGLWLSEDGTVERPY